MPLADLAGAAFRQRGRWRARTGMAARARVFAWMAVLAIMCVARPAAAAISCSLSVPNVAFGSTSLGTNAVVNTTSTATITCSGGNILTNYIFCTNIYSGSNVSGTQRRMASGALRLPYALYSDAAYSVPWGSWTGSYLSGGVQTITNSGALGNISDQVTVYAQIPAGQAAATVASYTDSLPGGTNQSLQYALYGGAGNTSCPLSGTGDATSPFSFSVSAMVVASCNVQNGSLSFGSTPYLTSAINGTGSVAVECSGLAPYSVGMGLGNYVSGSQRRMYSAATGGYVNYNLFTDNQYMNPWSTTTSSTACLSGAGTCVLGTGNGSYQTVPVYGTVPQQVGPAVGSYSDTVTVTVTY